MVIKVKYQRNMEKRVIIHYAITESCKKYRCANNIYILILLYHPKSLFFIIFLYFNEINCIFWEYS